MLSEEHLDYDALREYCKQLRSLDSENAYHSLLEFVGDIVPFLMQMCHQEHDPHVKAQLIEIISQRKHTPKVFQFLLQAGKHKDPIIWKMAIDGLVSIGGAEAMSCLRALELLNNLEPTKRNWILEAIEQVEVN